MHLPERSFIFLRHAQTAYNREGRFQGKIEVPLNDEGFKQAEAAANSLKDLTISRIIASPATRVIQTVRPYALKQAIPLHLENDLMEFFVGEFEGQEISAIRERLQLSKEQSWLSVLPEDADSWHDFLVRVCQSVHSWTEKYPKETLLIAAHGLVFRALTEALTGEPRSCENASPHAFQQVGGAWEVEPIVSSIVGLGPITIA